MKQIIEKARQNGLKEDFVQFLSNSDFSEEYV